MVVVAVLLVPLVPLPLPQQRRLASLVLLLAAVAEVVGVVVAVVAAAALLAVAAVVMMEGLAVVVAVVRRRSPTLRLMSLRCDDSFRRCTCVLAQRFGPRRCAGRRTTLRGRPTLPRRRREWVWVTTRT